MDEHNERTSLVRSDRTLSNDYNTGHGHLHNNDNNHNQPHPPRTFSSGRDDNASGRRGPRALLFRVQRGLAPFQTWAAQILRGEGDENSVTVVNWVQNARVARTFMMILNFLLAACAFILMGVEMVEMAVREPILDYLIPESELTLLVAGFTIVAGAFGFAVAYNLLVDEEDNANDEVDHHRGNSSGSGGGGGSGRDSRSRIRTPLAPSTDNILLGLDNDHPPVVPPQQQQDQQQQQQQQQQQHQQQHQQQLIRRPRLMFTKASTYLLNGNTIILTVALIAFIVSIAQRSVHLSGMEKEMNHAWTDAIRHRNGLISSFELRHECCGLNSLVDRPFPPLWGKPKEPLEPSDPKQPCSTNIAYGFQVPCRAELGKDFGRWQTRIQYLLLAEVTMLLPLLLLVMTLSVIGNLKLKEKKREELDDAEAQAEAVGAVPAAVDGREGATAQYGRNLLEDVPAHSGGTPFLINVEAEPVRVTNNHRPVVQPTLI